MLKPRKAKNENTTRRGDVFVIYTPKKKPRVIDGFAVGGLCSTINSLPRPGLFFNQPKHVRDIWRTVNRMWVGGTIGQHPTFTLRRKPKPFVQVYREYAEKRIAKIKVSKDELEQRTPSNFELLEEGLMAVGRPETDYDRVRLEEIVIGLRALHGPVRAVPASLVSTHISSQLQGIESEGSLNIYMDEMRSRLRHAVESKSGWVIVRGRDHVLSRFVIDHPSSYMLTAGRLPSDYQDPLVDLNIAPMSAEENTALDDLCRKVREMASEKNFNIGLPRAHRFMGYDPAGEKPDFSAIMPISSERSGAIMHIVKGRAEGSQSFTFGTGPVTFLGEELAAAEKHDRNRKLVEAFGQVTEQQMIEDMKNPKEVTPEAQEAVDKFKRVAFDRYLEKNPEVGSVIGGKVILWKGTSLNLLIEKHATEADKGRYKMYTEHIAGDCFAAEAQAALDQLNAVIVERAVQSGDLQELQSELNKAQHAENPLHIDTCFTTFFPRGKNKANIEAFTGEIKGVHLKNARNPEYAVSLRVLLDAIDNGGIYYSPQLSDEEKTALLLNMLFIYGK